MPFTIGGDWIPQEEEKEEGRKNKSRPVKVRRERRGHAIVTVILNLHKEEKELKVLATELKKKCGCGGTVKSSVIEIQGDNVEKVRQELLKLGIKSQ